MTRAGFDAGKDIELGEPIRPGDVLTASSRITEIYDKTGRSGTMTFLVFRHELRNQRDELVANVDNRLMQRVV
jgi:acyl dehydratase